MKKISFLMAVAVAATLFTSCSKDDYKSFIGTWGVEKIVYENYNTDWQGNPIQSSLVTETYNYDPEDIGHGIQLVFREDKTGEMRDNDVDSLRVITGNDTIYIHCPDTTIVTRFTFSYDKDESILFMNLTDHAETFMMKISELTDDSFVYENNYGIAEDNRTYFETAYMKRISGKSAGSKALANPKSHPRTKGSLFGDR